MTFVSRVVTVHAEVGMPVRLAVLDALEGTLLEQGAIRIWVDPASSPEIVVLAEFSDSAKPRPSIP